MKIRRILRTYFILSCVFGLLIACQESVVKVDSAPTSPTLTTPKKPCPELKPSYELYKCAELLAKTAELSSDPIPPSDSWLDKQNYLRTPIHGSLFKNNLDPSPYELDCKQGEDLCTDGNASMTYWYYSCLSVMHKLSEGNCQPF